MFRAKSDRLPASGPFLAVLSWLVGIVVFSVNTIQTRAAQLSAPHSLTEEELAADENDLMNHTMRVGNSSVWIWKSDYPNFVNDSALPKGLPLVFLHGPISPDDIPVFRRLLAPYLDSKYVLSHQKPSWYKPYPSDIGYTIDLDSPGGDVYSAMELGRIFRKARVNATVGISHKCLSSCVLLLAGAVDRTIFGSVGIHRPYSTDTSAGSFEEAQAIATKLGTDVSTYLREMNIPTSLYDAMTQTPPEAIRILTFADLRTFGLYESDPVFQELNDNLEANMAHISKSELMVRKADSERCKRAGYERLRQINNGREPGMLEVSELFRRCDEKTIYLDR